MNARQERILTTLFQMAKDNKELRMKAQKFASNSNSEEINTSLYHYQFLF